MQLAMLLFSVFAFSRGSIGIAIPAVVWFAVMFVVIALSAMSILSNIRLRANSAMAFMVYVICIIFLYRNQDIKHGVFAEAFFCATAMILCVALMGKSNWYELLIKTLVVVGLFYAFWTIAATVDSNVYSNFILPWLRRFEPSTPRGNYMCGFTTHYSTNGMYIALGTMATIARIFQKVRFGKVQETDWLILCVLVFALALSGKRGIVICVLLSFFACYLFMTNSHGRLFKLMLICCVGVLILYITSFWFKPILTTLERFAMQIQAGDISSGRFRIWSEAWKGFAEKPIFGHGWGWFRYNNTFGIEYHAHNCYLQWLCELGIVFALPMYYFVFSHFFHAFRLLRYVALEKNAQLVLNGIVNYQAVCFAFLFEVYFLFFMFEGTAFYEIHEFFIYFLCVVIVEHYWRQIRSHGIREVR